MQPADIESLPITFWQNMPSHHMSPVQSSLSKYWQGKIRVINVSQISEVRLKQGWTDAKLTNVESITLHRDAVRAVQLAKESSGINIFGGFGNPILHKAWKNLPSTPSTYRGLILEKGIPLGLKGLFRPYLHTLKARLLNKQTSFVLAFGEDAVVHYRRGFDKHKIYPFMYQVSELSDATNHPEVDTPEIVYVGGLSRRKGVDLLLSALKKLDYFAWNLTILGDGPEKPKMQRYCRKLGIEDRVCWKGAIPASSVVKELAQYDLCVVPSRFDGWGMAVNEAIEAGIAVLTTPTVGSKDLVKGANCGLISEATSARALESALNLLLSQPNSLKEGQLAAQTARKRFRGDSVAQYLAKTLEHTLSENKTAPLPPWK